MAFVLSRHHTAVSCSLLFLPWALSAAGHEESHLVGKARGVWAGEAWFRRVRLLEVLLTAHVMLSVWALSVLHTAFVFTALHCLCPGAFQPFQDSDSGIICHHCSNYFLIPVFLLLYISHPLHWDACGHLALTKHLKHWPAKGTIILCLVWCEENGFLKWEIPATQGTRE